MAIANAILLGVNEITNIVASSELASLPATNLYNDQPSELWRAAAETDVTFTGSFSSARQISGVALSNHNLTSEMVRLELALDAEFLNVVYDETWTAREPEYGWGEGTWGNLYSTWGGYALDDGGLNTQLIKTFTAVGAVYWRVTISGVADKTPEAGTLFLGIAFRPGIGVRRDPSQSVVDPSIVTRTRGQAIRSDNQPTYRRLDFQYVALTASEAMEFKRICRSSGRRKLMVVSLIPGAGGAEEKEAKMVCRLIDWAGPTRIEAAVDPYYTASVTLEEAL